MNSLWKQGCEIYSPSNISTTSSMQPKPISPIRTAWYTWKSQRWVPWRKRFLVGLDLHGNTFWEFRDTFSSHRHRMRRIVQYPSSAHLSDVKVSPQWLQWLRHTRTDAPSLSEQSQDVVRQDQIKILAKMADQRWAAKPSVLDAPGQAMGQPGTAIGTSMAANTVRSSRGDAINLSDEDKPRSQERQTSRGHVETQVPERTRHGFNEQSNGEISPASKGEKEKEDPWKQARGGPSEQWQPQAWGGGKVAARR